MSPTPMFPLSNVLLPNMPLTLRIFEERYLKLLGDLLEQEEPEFGVVLIERGQEVGGLEKRFSIGTIAEVVSIGTTDELYGLVATGGRRFIINAWLPDDPYPIADIDLIADLVWHDSLEPLRKQTEAQVRHMLAFASEFTDLQWDADIELSDDPMAAVWQLAGIMPVGALDQLDLLKSLSTEELLTQTLRMAVEAEQTLRDSLL